MGIDKPNVRYTINITHPSSIESYVQEAGRGGRDKKVAISYLLHEPTEYIKLSAELLGEMCGQNIPPFFSNLTDKIILFKDLRQAFVLLGIDEPTIDAYITFLAKHKLNADKEVQMYFHNNSFKGVYKEKIILRELTYNTDQTLQIGIYRAINNIPDNKSVEVVIPWVNRYETNSAQFDQLVLTAAISVANKTGWVPPVSINAFEKSSYDELVEHISNMTNDTNWRIHSQSTDMDPVKTAFFKRRDRLDTDKAIYRLSCIGLVDDVTIDYNKHLYTVKVSKKNDDYFFETLRHFFEKYYSAEQAQKKTNAARGHRGNNASDKCMGYLAEFVYENLETKRKRAIDDMRDACLKGVSMGDDALKDYIHLYFNSKYARDTHEIDGVNYSLKQDVADGLPVFDIIWKYINVMGVDPSGPEADNVKHLYGAVLIILRAQAKDNIANTALYILRTFCLACLGTNNNETLIDEFQEGYTTHGFNRIIKELCDIDPIIIKNNHEKINDIIKLKSKPSEKYLVEYIDNIKNEINIRIVEKFYHDFCNKYTNNDEKTIKI